MAARPAPRSVEPTDWVDVAPSQPDDWQDVPRGTSPAGPTLPAGAPQAAGQPSGPSAVSGAFQRVLGLNKGIYVNPSLGALSMVKRVLAGPQDEIERAIVTTHGLKGLLIYDAARAQMGEAEKATEAAKGGRTAEMVARSVAAAVPLLGPAVAGSVEKMASPDPMAQGEGGGELVSTLAGLVGGPKGAGAVAEVPTATGTTRLGRILRSPTVRAAAKEALIDKVIPAKVRRAVREVEKAYKAGAPADDLPVPPSPAEAPPVTAEPAPAPSTAATQLKAKMPRKRRAKPAEDLGAPVKAETEAEAMARMRQQNEAFWTSTRENPQASRTFAPTERRSAADLSHDLANAAEIPMRTPSKAQVPAEVFEVGARAAKTETMVELLKGAGITAAEARKMTPAQWQQLGVAARAKQLGKDALTMAEAGRVKPPSAATQLKVLNQLEKLK